MWIEMGNRAVGADGDGDRSWNRQPCIYFHRFRETATREAADGAPHWIDSCVGNADRFAVCVVLGRPQTDQQFLQPD